MEEGRREESTRNWWLDLNLMYYSDVEVETIHRKELRMSNHTIV